MVINITEAVIRSPHGMPIIDFQDFQAFESHQIKKYIEEMDPIERAFRTYAPICINIDKFKSFRKGFIYFFQRDAVIYSYFRLINQNPHYWFYMMNPEVLCSSSSSSKPSIIDKWSESVCECENCRHHRISVHIRNGGSAILANIKSHNFVLAQESNNICDPTKKESNDASDV